MSSKTSATILQEMIDNLSINTNFTDVDKSAGSVLRDVSLDSVAKQLALVYAELEANKNMYFFLDRAEIISHEDMDSIANDFNLIRLVSKKATGEILFRKKSIPNTPITIGTIDGKGGILLATRQLSDGAVVQFITTETVTLQNTAILNPLTNYYEVVAKIEAIIAGVSGNISTGSITNLESSVSGIDTVYNTIPTVGGAEEETNTELASRIILAIAGNSRVNRSGYELFIKNNFVSVNDILVVDPNNPDSVRGPGTIDIHIFGSEIAVHSEDITYTDGVTEYNLTSRPVSSIDSLVAKVSGTDTILTQGVDYELQKDTTSTLSYGTKANDKVKFIDLGIKPDNGTVFTIVYSYNKLVADIQDFYNLDENNILGIDVMIKETVAVLFDISFSLNYYSGNALKHTELENKIVTALTTYLEGLGLGAEVSQSDIVLIARNAVPEIDNITLPFTLFKRKTETANSDKISLKSKEYIYVDSTTFTITPL